MLVLGRPGAGCSSFLKAMANDREAYAAVSGDVSYGGISAEEEHKRFRGEVVTIKCFEDNSRVKERLSTPGKGKVLVIDAGGSARCAVLGDVIAVEAVKNRWEGVLVFGYVRDSRALATLDIGVKALGVTPRKSVRRGEGSVNIRISFAGVHFDVGDILIADEDGVIVLTKAQANE